MKCLLISDIHIDINESVLEYQGGSIESFKFINELKDIDWLFIAGDISGSYKDTYKFLLELEEYIKNNNLKTKVVAVAGNHESYASKEEKMSRTQIISKLKQSFDGDVIHFIEDNIIKLNEDTLLFGCCLYTNFGNSIYNERMAIKSINDFKYSYEFDIFEDKTLPVTPQEYIKWHNTSINKLLDLCEKNKDKKIIILTHFAPSYKSISPEYVLSPLNPFYATDLEQIIKDNKNIKIWNHGHVHSPCRYKIEECEVICSPYGYYLFDNSTVRPSEYSGTTFEI